ncbi:MAG: ShlB/FhaC/HecB family hemolysin secretion/activation protein [Verrucomicrobia bacterium]|nr:ShlB/FhaC/HecB family hemolysin secretion/activation protein [Verrucomicrobiota bacterium]
MPKPCFHTSTLRRACRAGTPLRLGVLVCACVSGVLTLRVTAQESGAPAPAQPPADQQAAQQTSADEPTLYIREYRVVGSKALERPAVEEAVYGYLGPGRTAQDVEGARAALEKAYRDKGFQTVSVSVPMQRAAGGVVFLQVTEAPVGRLRVNGSRFYDINKIKARVPSLAQGTLPNFNKVEKEIIALNQSGDLQITPSLAAGVMPGTVDVNLVVKDKFPLHGSVELNNRYSANTTPLRLDLSLRYDNLWQLGHTIGFGFQIAPQRIQDALIYSGYYIAPVPGVDWLSVMAQAIRQNSNVSTLGGSAVAGNGSVIGGRLLFDLPGKKGFFHSASFGADYKDFTQDLSINGATTGSPIQYFPFSLSYTAAWVGKNYQTEFSGGVTWSFRGIGSDETDFDNRRYASDASFFYFRGSLGNTLDLPWGFQAYGLVQGQASAQPLVDTEEFALGGLNTVRGYLESAVLGDSAFAGTLELRSPSLLWWAPEGNEWRVFGFLDGGVAWVNDPLPEQQDEFSLASAGVGSTIKLFEHLNGSVVLGVPFITQSPNTAYDPLLSFRVWGEL